MRRADVQGHVASRLATCRAEDATDLTDVQGHLCPRKRALCANPCDQQQQVLSTNESVRLKNRIYRYAHGVGSGYC